MRKINILCCVAGLFLACIASAVSGQTSGKIRATSKDLKRAILAQKSFAESRSHSSSRGLPVFIVDSELTNSELPRRKGIVFKIIPESDIERMREEGVNYYEFVNFETNGSKHSIVLSRTYIKKDQVSGESYQYSGRKVRGRWKLRRGMGTFVDSWN